MRNSTEILRHSLVAGGTTVRSRGRRRYTAVMRSERDELDVLERLRLGRQFMDGAVPTHKSPRDASETTVSPPMTR